MGALPGYVLFFLLTGVALTYPAVQDSKSISISGLSNIHWPPGRPSPVKVTKTHSGAHLGWIYRHDQVDTPIASPPPPLDAKLPHDLPTPELLLPGAQRGPAGTVPFQLIETNILNNIPNKQPPPQPHKSHVKEKRAVGDHYYGNSYQTATNYGGSFTMSLFNTSVTGPGSFALIQTAVVNNKKITQTVETGWQIYPYLNNGSNVPHIFTYFTTNGYQSSGDNVGGYNTFQKGWVQSDSSYYPGMTFSPLSTVGGPQYEMPVAVQLFQGNWWINVGGHWMGYYPGSNFKISGNSTGTMAENSNSISYYGEIVDSYVYPPKTDMGSGQFASTGFGKSAYMHNMTLYNTATTYVGYNGVVGVSNASWYTVDAHFNSGGSWASYFYLGGPGAG